MSIERVFAVAEKYQKNTKAPLGFAFKDLVTGKTVSYHGDEPFPTASAYKVFILAELYRKAWAGECDLGQRIELTDDIKSVGSGVLAEMQAGLNPTLRDYAHLMMILSDNTATDVLFRFVGRENIRKNVIEPLGLKNTKCDWGCNKLCDIYYDMKGRTFRELAAENRNKKDSEADYWNSIWYKCITEENDQTSPLEAAKMLELLYRGKWVSPKASTEMLSIMKKCQTNSRIPKYLPDYVEIAHKTGSLGKLNVDIGIVFAEPKGAYILCMFYNGNLASREDYDANDRGRVGDAYLADLSGELYKAYMEN